MTSVSLHVHYAHDLCLSTLSISLLSLRIWRSPPYPRYACAIYSTANITLLYPYTYHPRLHTRATYMTLFSILALRTCHPYHCAYDFRAAHMTPPSSLLTYEILLPTLTTHMKLISLHLTHQCHYSRYGYDILLNTHTTNMPSLALRIQFSRCAHDTPLLLWGGFD